jgi:hypothetical protein
MPNRKQFLWWYWLLLASIIGIPMFLAALYVARHSSEDDKESAGLTAAVIFWGSVVLSVLVFSQIAYAALELIHGDRTSAANWHGPLYTLTSAYWHIVLNFLLSFAGAQWVVGAAGAAKPLYQRIPAVVGVAVLWLFLAVIFNITTAFVAPFVLVLQLLVCLPAAYYWRGFRKRPDQPGAWRASAGVVVSLAAFALVLSFVPELVT